MRRVARPLSRGRDNDLHDEMPRRAIISLITAIQLTPKPIFLALSRYRQRDVTLEHAGAKRRARARPRNIRIISSEGNEPKRVITCRPASPRGEYFREVAGIIRAARKYNSAIAASNRRSGSADL